LELIRKIDLSDLNRCKTTLLYAAQAFGNAENNIKKKRMEWLQAFEKLKKINNFYHIDNHGNKIYNWDNIIDLYRMEPKEKWVSEALDSVDLERLELEMILRDYQVREEDMT